MAMAHFDVSLAYDQIVKRGVPGQVARVSDADTDLPYAELLDLDGNPLAALVSNSQGYVPPFQIQDGPALVKMSVGGVTYYLQDLNLFGGTALAAQQAAADAQKAAGLVEAPADEVVATLVQGGTLTQTAGDARWVTNEGADHTVSALFESQESETRTATDTRYVNRAVPLYDASRAYRKKVKHSLPFQFPGWDTVKSIWGYQIYPQGFTVDESADELFVIYSGTAQVVAVYEWTSGDFKTAFQLGTLNTQVSEGLGVTHEGGSRYLFARAGISSMGKYDITVLPTIGSSVTQIGAFENGMGRTMTQTKSGWIVNSGARRDLWLDQDNNFATVGYVNLPVGLTGATAATDSATAASTPKIQGICEHQGRIVTSIGGQQFLDQPTIPYGYQGIRVHAKSGQLLLDALVDPVGFADVIETVLNSRPRLVEAEGIFPVGEKLYSLTVTHGWNESEAPIASVEGVLIMEELCADNDALDFSPKSVSSVSPDLRVIGAFQQPTNSLGTPVNPVTGSQLDTITKIAQYLIDSGQFVFQHYITGSNPIQAPDGSNVSSWNVLRMTKASAGTVFVELFGLSGSALWRSSLSGGVWSWEQPNSLAPQSIVFDLGAASYDPRVWKENGVVQLDGGINVTGLAAGVYHAVAQLPAECRPAKYQYYPTVVPNSAVRAEVRVAASGVLEVQISATTTASVLLTGVRYRAA